MNINLRAVSDVPVLLESAEPQSVVPGAGVIAQNDHPSVEMDVEMETDTTGSGVAETFRPPLPVQQELAIDTAGNETLAERLNERWSSLRSSNVAANTSAAETFLATLGEDQVLVVRAVVNNARVPILHSSDDLARRELRRQIHLREPWVDKEFALKISVKAAI
jgi:hypothetical protein